MNGETSLTGAEDTNVTVCVCGHPLDVSGNCSTCDMRRPVTLEQLLAWGDRLPRLDSLDMLDQNF